MGRKRQQPAAEMQLPFALLVIPLNSVTSENLAPTKKEPQTGNPGSKFPDTNKHGEVRSGHFTSGSESLQHSSGNIDGEEPLLYGFFPDGFIWGAATSALQVEGWGDDDRGLAGWDVWAEDSGHVTDGSDASKAAIGSATLMTWRESTTTSTTSTKC